MSGRDFVPVYAIAFLIVSIIQKVYLYYFNSIERILELSYFFTSPFMFIEDIIIAVLIFVAIDWSLYRLNRKRKNFIKNFLKIILNMVYFLIITYSFLMLKFYSLFGSYLTYDLLIQAHKVGSYKAGIMQEIDGTAVYLFVLSAIFSFSVFLLRRSPDRRKETAETAPLMKSYKKYIAVSVVIFFYLVLSVNALNIFHKDKNLFSIDRNPLYELIASLNENAGVSGGAGRAETGENKTSSYVSDSIVNSNSIVRGIALKNINKKFLKNMNVIFYLFESTSGNYTGVLNDEFKSFTPNIIKIASRSLFLGNHYCQEPASLKSLYSVLTGRYSYKTRNWKQFIKKAENDITIAEILKKQGYDTIFITTQDGRIYYQNRLLEKRFNKIIDKNEIKRRKPKYRDFSFSIDDRALPDVFDEYLSAQKDKFFAFISTGFPHHPYLIPSKKFKITGGRSSFDRYKNSLYFSDYVLGRVYNLLEKHNLKKNTIFVIFSDHGEAFYQHRGNFIHSIYLYEENVKTFCIISNPLLFDRRLFMHITSHIDITPTVLDILSLKEDSYGFDGISLLKPHREKTAAFYTGWADFKLGLRDGRWKYILNTRYNSQELYDLSADSSEKNNISSRYPGLSQKFKEKLLKLEKYIQ